MLGELRRHVPESVVTIQGRFEELPLGASYDLVFAAASFHWTRAEGRWARVATLLEPGGVFASFGGSSYLAEQEVEALVREARAPFMDDDEVPSPDGTPHDEPMQWPGSELEQSALFSDVRQVAIRRRPTTSREEYVGLLSTVSAYLVLPDADRDVVLGRILDVLPERVAIDADITLHLARKV
jgi:SAM-dependent methyltransferase